MQSQNINFTVNIPSTADFASLFPHYGPHANGAGRLLFDLVMQPEVFVKASVLTDILGLPAVTAVAADAVQVMGGSLERMDKQFGGALFRSLMEANGYIKSNTKRSIPHPAWNRGEVYKRP